MDYKSMFTGVGTAIVTPFTVSGGIDWDAFKRVVDYQISNHISYLVFLGTTGEVPVLSIDEKQQIINFAYEYVAGRVPIVIGVGGNHTQEVLHELQTLNLSKAQAVLSVSPYYSKPSQAGLLAHYQAIANTSPLPVILYNVPARTARSVSAETIIELAAHPNIIGMKDAGGNFDETMQVLKQAPADFFVTSGDDALALPQMACGMVGVISVAANAFPQLLSEMIALCLQNKFQQSVQINNQLLQAYQLMFAENSPAGVKSFLHHQGIIENNLRLPNVPVNANLNGAIKNFVEQHAELWS